MASSNNLRRARWQAGLRQSDLSQLSSVSVRFISAVEDDRLRELMPCHWVRQSTDGSKDDRPRRVMQRTLYRWAKRLHQLAQALDVPFDVLFPDDYLDGLGDEVWVQLYSFWNLHAELNEHEPPVCPPNPLSGWGWFKEVPLSDVMQDDQAHKDLEHKVLTQVIQCTLADLPAADQQVLTLHYGLKGGPAYTIVEIADQLGVSAQAIWSILDHAFRKLRHPDGSRLLRDYRCGSRSDWWPYSVW